MPPLPTLELLFRAARIVNERAVARVQAAGGGLRQAHTLLFPHITRDGIRLTELAAKLDVSKQAIGPLVDDLEAAKLVERVDDPADRRAKLIRWTPHGLRALDHGRGVLTAFEAELAGAVGKARMAALRDALERVLAAVGG